MTINRRQFSSGTLSVGFGALAPAAARAEPPDAEPAPSEPAAAAPASKPLHIGYIPVIGAAALLVFARSQMATMAGLSITLVRLDPAAALVPPPVEGRWDALAVGVAPLALARAAGADVTIVCGLATAGSGLVAVPALAASFDAARGEPARALAAFKAKAGRVARIATSPRGVVPAVLLDHWLFKLHAVPPDLVDILPMDPAALQTAITTGSVDGATLPEPASTIVRARDPTIQRVIAGSAMFPDMPGLMLGVSEDFAQDNDATVRALVQGLVGATRHIRQDVAKSAVFVQEGLGLPEADRPLVARALASSNIGFVTDPRALEPAARAMLAFESERGDFATRPETTGLFDASYYPAAARSSAR